MSYPKRVIFLEGEQKKFLESAFEKLNFDTAELAIKLGVHPRSVRDWRREKYSIPLSAMDKVCKMGGFVRPVAIRIEDPFWYVDKGAKLGGIAVYKKYGRVGAVDEKYRKKKWFEWWQQVGRYRKNAIGESKPVKRPKLSEKVAEFVGIMLGDGGITKYQLDVSISSVVDKGYEEFIIALIKELFEIVPTVYVRNDSNTLIIRVSSIEVVRFCNKVGLKTGNKLKQGLNIPSWIMQSAKLKRACLRGLIDTDGCIFNERHRVRERIYTYQRLNFVSYSPALIGSAFYIFKEMGLSPKIRNQGKSVQIENRQEIKRYFDIIGSHNPKHLLRFNGEVG